MPIAIGRLGQAPRMDERGGVLVELDSTARRLAKHFAASTASQPLRGTPSHMSGRVPSSELRRAPLGHARVSLGRPRCPRA